MIGESEPDKRDAGLPDRRVVTMIGPKASHAQETACPLNTASIGAWAPSQGERLAMWAMPLTGISGPVCLIPPWTL
jgi:hypothetical protein